MVLYLHAKGMSIKFTIAVLFCSFAAMAGDPSLLWGLYRGNGFELHLKPDGRFLFDPLYVRCGLFLPGSVSGHYLINGDTVFLKEEQGIWEKKLVLYHDTNIKYTHQQWLNFNRFLVEAKQSPETWGNKLTDVPNKHQISGEKYYQFSAYYPNRQLAWLSSSAGNCASKISYYDNGKVSAVFTYSKFKKTGIWLYYDYQGKLKRTEKYRRNRKISSTLA